jgi:hypothetical protein
MVHVSENLRYLLWRARIRRDNWPTELARWARCNRSRAEQILQGAELLPDELGRIAQAAGISENELLSARLLDTEGVDVLLENVRHLINSLDRGQKKLLAENLKVHATTISRWISGDLQPRRAHLIDLCSYFELPSDTNLTIEPIFLSLPSISALERREWLRRRIDEIDTTTLHKLYPALERLLAEQ